MIVTPNPRRLLPVLSAAQITSLRAELADVIEYRKSGLSLNHIYETNFLPRVYLMVVLSFPIAKGPTAWITG